MTHLALDDPKFMPESTVDGRLLLSANVSSTLNIAFRGILNIDCGIELDIPAGYEPRFETTFELASKGLLAGAVRFKSGKKYQRVEIVVLNQGKEIIPIYSGMKIGILGIDPVLGLIWDKENVITFERN